MNVKDGLLFIIVCGLAGVGIFLGSVLGNSMGKAGLFLGAVAGGIIGVGAAVWLAVRFGFLDRAAYAMTFSGGVLGFIVAAVIAVKNLDGPLIPMASVALIGLGAFIGKLLWYRRAA